MLEYTDNPHLQWKKEPTLAEKIESLNTPLTITPIHYTARIVGADSMVEHWEVRTKDATATGKTLEEAVDNLYTVLKETD